jgi:hypothetical protein
VRYVFPLIIAFGLVACADKDKSANTAAAVPKAEAPKIDSTTPDSTVKSLWALRDQRAALNEKLCRSDSGTVADVKTNDELVKQLVEGAVKSTFSAERNCIADKIRREIQEVKIETETRAVVFAAAYNITPIPAGAEPDKYDSKWRAEGFRYKYLLEKMSGKWLITQIYQVDQFDTSGEQNWKPQFSTDNKPRVPASVYIMEM